MDKSLRDWIVAVDAWARRADLSLWMLAVLVAVALAWVLREDRALLWFAGP